MAAYLDAGQDEPVIRINALRIFRREYFHALRNGLSSDDASERAFERVREAFNAHPLIKGLSGIDREERWSEVLGPVVEFQILLRDVPIDKTAIPPKPQIDLSASDPCFDQLKDDAPARGDE